ncbi:DUF3152 domain-containing protein [Kineosporia babensis]|uniref:DUF3152 domain-containing protein n=1 Tax=Kineosporia babensis TaxID=499548 RepID=A0A9X1NKM1_9ACTN|nr:DUF3152 domain-containing protein [Kineosporia babensis]
MSRLKISARSVGAAVVGAALAGAVVLMPAGEVGSSVDDGLMSSSDADGTAAVGTVELVSASAAAKPRKITYPKAGKNTFKVATGRSKVAGKKGPLLKYRVVVEKGITGITANQFAEQVVTTLSDKRSWTGTGTVRLQRVPNSARYDFTIYLATPQTRDTLCGDATRANPDRYTSCRNGDRVVVNVARWVNGVPHYGASLERYRAYVINHETGHRLGHGHVKCPGKGRTAPVMQQQTLGLHGCKANAWPKVKGKLYTGPAGAYQDPVPKA